MNIKKKSFLRVPKKSLSSAFTIVELLIVIVIISILAAITIVSYTGITKKANEAVILSDLANNKKKMSLYHALYSSYPTSLDGSNCALLPNPDNNYCLKFSSGVSLGSYSGSVDSFSLSANGNGVAYVVTDSGSPIAISTKWKMLASGLNHTCGILDDDKAYCWGRNDYGQLGNRLTTDSSVPVLVNINGAMSGKIISDISIGLNSTCANTTIGQVYCWGKNDYGQLGNNSTINSIFPVAVDTSGVLNSKTITKIASGPDHVCAVASDNQAYCWGRGEYGALGNENNATSSVPVAVSRTGVLNGKTIKIISSGFLNTCVIASDDKVYCWGYNPFGESGNGTTNNSTFPVAVDFSGVLNGKTVKYISSGYDMVCAIASNDQAYCWGRNYFGQLGNNSMSNSSVPVAVNTTGVLSGKTIKTISAGGYHVCLVASDDQIYCWGNNGEGEFGNNSSIQSSVPVTTSMSGALSGKTIKLISSSYCNTCVIASNDLVYCWGYNAYGQLGNGMTVNSLVPVQSLLP